MGCPMMVLSRARRNNSSAWYGRSPATPGPLPEKGMLNEDYSEMLHILSEEGVDFIIVGAYALDAKVLRRGER